CFFQKIKNYRRIATRYEKLAARFPGFVHLVCIPVWLM
ncbi:MAG: transposase, partial [Lachnospiraceae bacterium]|nr:transposase [Lachnospiraceae bacterium]